MKQTDKKITKQSKVIYVNDYFNPENMTKNISEYFYNKGFINGLQQGNQLDENKLSALIAVYEAKTKYVDKLLESD